MNLLARLPQISRLAMKPSAFPKTSCIIPRSSATSSIKAVPVPLTPMRFFGEGRNESRVAERRDDGEQRDGQHLGHRDHYFRRNRFGRHWSEFDDFFSNPWGLANKLMDDGNFNISKSTEFDWNPRVDIITKDGGFTILAEIPGVQKESIKLEVENEVLTIKGAKKSEHEEGKEGGDFHRRERFFGTFMRQFQLPSGTDPKSIKSSYKDGILKVEIPKTAEQKAHQVQIEGL